MGACRLFIVKKLTQVQEPVIQQTNWHIQLNI